jgi:phosphatidylserine/phosphatidylglycerophosphate/cardiolipin synthase-like enzyme
MENNILQKIIKSIQEANEFIYISVPWWWSDTVGEKICDALHDAKRRGVNINVELRPTVQNKKIRQKLSSFDTEITENVKLHMKVVCSEKEYSLTTANFHNKDMLINDNEIEQFRDKERIKNYIDSFESRKQKKNPHF